MFVFYIGCRSIILTESTYPSQIIYAINIYHYAKAVNHVLSFLPISSHCIFIYPPSLCVSINFSICHLLFYILYYYSHCLFRFMFVSAHLRHSQFALFLVSLLFHLSIKVYLLRLFSVCSAFFCTLSLSLLCLHVFSHFPGFVDLDFAVPISLYLFLYVISVLFMFYIL